MPRIRVGVIADTAYLLANPDRSRQYCEILESAGVESVWTTEHVVVSASYRRAFPYSSSGRMSVEPSVDRPDPIEFLAWLAGQSSILTLGTSVLVAPVHNPLLLAKRAATVDVLSRGRLILGL